MFFDLLHFGSGSQALNYFLFCFAAILGTIQSVAVHYKRLDLMWFEGHFGYGFSLLTVAGSFVWFFLTDREIFIPGLAGGELFTLFIVAFLAAVPVTRAIALVAARVRALALPPKRPAREKEPLL
ncbi:MAG: hypothetical protein KGJ80_21535 [Chloroflexota bacterium]|nr:hypothetical protein [Chloroflexota bacterium]